MFPEEFAELVERPGIIQAPYFARNQWVALETEDALTAAETQAPRAHFVQPRAGEAPEKTPRRFAMMVETHRGFPPAWPVLRHN
jgi:hypothetical protein